MSLKTEIKWDSWIDDKKYRNKTTKAFVLKNVHGIQRKMILLEFIL